MGLKLQKWTIQSHSFSKHLKIFESVKYKYIFGSPEVEGKSGNFGFFKISLTFWYLTHGSKSPAEHVNFENFRFSFNFRRSKSIFILNRFKKCWMFWKAMGLNRSFLQSKSRRTRLWYPLKILSVSNYIVYQLAMVSFRNAICGSKHRPKINF